MSILPLLKLVCFFLFLLTAVTYALGDIPEEIRNCTNKSSGNDDIIVYKNYVNGITFGSLHKLDSSFDGYTVSQMEDDLLIQGNILYSTSAGMIYSFNPETREHSLVSPDQYMPSDEGADEVFGVPIISPFIQISKTEIIVLDTSGNCLRSFPRSTYSNYQPKTVAGECGAADSIVDGSFVKARFSHPRAIKLAPKSQKLYLVDRASVRQLDLKEREVSTLLMSAESCWYLFPGMITVDRSEENIYIGVMGFCSGVIRYNLALNTCTFVARDSEKESGSCLSDEYSIRGLGELTPSSNLILNEHTFIFSQLYTYDLTIIDLQTKCTSTVCVPKVQSSGSHCSDDVCQDYDNIPDTVEGSIDKCVLQRPLSMTMSNSLHSILIATTDGIMVLPITTETVPVAKDIQPWWPRNLEGLLMYCDDTMSTFMEAIIACGYVGLTESSSLLIRVVVIFSLFLIITLSFWFCHKKSSLREPVEHAVGDDDEDNGYAEHGEDNSENGGEDNSDSGEEESCPEEENRVGETRPDRDSHGNRGRGLNQYQQQSRVTRLTTRLLQSQRYAKQESSKLEVTKLKPSLANIRNHTDVEVPSRNEKYNGNELEMPTGNIDLSPSYEEEAHTKYRQSITEKYCHESAPVSSYSLRSSYCAVEQPDDNTPSSFTSE